MKLSNKTIREAVEDWVSDSIQASLKWGPIEDWDTSQVTDMSRMFYEATSFSADLSRWDVRRVTNMKGMFCEAPSFSANLSQWDVRRVTNMGYMFYKSGIYEKWGCTTLDQMGSNHPYQKVSRLYALAHLPLNRGRSQSISMYM